MEYFCLCVFIHIDKCVGCPLVGLALLFSIAASVVALQCMAELVGERAERLRVTHAGAQADPPGGWYPCPFGSSGVPRDVDVVECGEVVEVFSHRIQGFPPAI